MTADDELRRDLARTIADAIDPEMDDDPFDAAADAILRAFRVERRGEPEPAAGVREAIDLAEAVRGAPFDPQPTIPSITTNSPAAGEREPTPPAARCLMLCDDDCDAECHAGHEIEQHRKTLWRFQTDTLEEAAKMADRHGSPYLAMGLRAIIRVGRPVAAGESPNPANGDS